MWPPEKGFQELVCTEREGWVVTLQKSLLSWTFISLLAMSRLWGTGSQVQGASQTHITWLKGKFDQNIVTTVFLSCIQKIHMSKFCVLSLTIYEPVLSVLMPPISL